MTKRRDQDIMALEHAIKALNKSTPRMFPHNLAFIVDRWKSDLARIGMYVDDNRPPIVFRP